MTAIWWEPKVIDLPAMDMKQANERGHMKPSWGQVKFAPDTYTGAPPRKAEINLNWGVTYSGSIHIFDGTIMLRKATTRELVYDIFESEFEQELLDEGVTVEGDEIVRPWVMGSVVHMNPVRTGSPAERKYYMPNFSGSIGSGINAYDDGVLINDSWTDNGDGTVNRSVNIVGELTFSGTGQITTLVGLFQWACAELGLTLNTALADDCEIDTVETSQQYIIDFISHVAWYCDHGFYILDGVLYLVSNNSDNGSQSVGLGEGTSDPVKITYNWPQPTKKYTAKWTTRYAKTDSDGSRIESESHDLELMAGFAVIGIDRSMGRVFNRTRSKIRTRVQAILDRVNMAIIEVELPLYRLPRYGERISFRDEISVNHTEGYVRCREYNLNYSAKTVRIKGDGEVTFI